MASRKVIRDLVMTKQPLFLQLAHQRRVGARLGLMPVNGYSINRRFSIFSDFSKKIRGEAESNPEFQRTVKELKEKADELKGVKEDLKVKTKEKTEQLYKQVDGVWTEAESVAKKVSSSVKDKFSAATEEVKESFKLGKEENAESASSSGTGASKEENQQQQQQSGNTEGGQQHTLFGKIKSSISSPLDLAKKGLDIVKDELRGGTPKKKHLEYTPPPPFTGVRSERTDLVVTPTKQSKWQKKWESLREKMQAHPAFKRLSGISEPVVSKSQEIAEDVVERWETSDNPIVHKIQDLNEAVFNETDSGSTYKEIRRRDPTFSLTDFAAEVHEAIKPVLSAYSKGDAETLKKFCSAEVIERCTAELAALKGHDLFFDHKILHISEVEVEETKMMGTTPTIIVRFQTQEIFCVRDKNGNIKEGGQDTIHSVYYKWAMQQVDAGEESMYPIWRLRDVCKLGAAQALI
ncbi:Mitochondrial import inner membrane translocase subunit TIM44-2 [Raphanus sativus]|uniref:Mitochondrial import inner membrane translocase subunit TIM44-2 n=1 Tax=Raphanus sativus TaxID=3726 RepID=A0A6J0JFB2_RAPSA|nr:mitochondrial import inner membrane translocase subunit TIM44-2 [Raphanus sativus]KAJ4888855.1 Mitochondrial import inner membrane translocase subunit TIM44-2 [Raphanus sativus]